MWHSLGVALCLMTIIEGLVLFAFPAQWQRFMVELASVPPQRVRAIGGISIFIGLACLQLAR